MIGQVNEFYFKTKQKEYKFGIVGHETCDTE